MVSFRKTWNSKMVKNKMSAVIDGSTDGAEIADKFTRHFQQNWSSHNDNHPESDPGSALMPDIVGYMLVFNMMISHCLMLSLLTYVYWTCARCRYKLNIFCTLIHL